MENLKQEFINELASINDEKALIELKNKYFSKKGLITELMNNIKNVEDKKAYGQQVNELKEELYALFNQKMEVFEQQKLEKTLKKDALDVTRTPLNQNLGHTNILLQTKREIEAFFISQGFELTTGDEIDTDYNNFTALNLDEFHPARNMQDTFYIDKDILLRTQTSNIQTKLLRQFKNQELKFICSGKVYRRDDDDATHSHQFMQLEGFCIVDKRLNHHANLRDLKALLAKFARTIFKNDQLQIRFRPSFFPFTEPSFEVDVTCSKCLGSGCAFCKHTGFIEVLGAGIVDKSVLELAGIDATNFSGYAFGIGIERIALLKYNIDDIRQFYVNDHRFLDQF